jgi:hypothetical protein
MLFISLFAILTNMSISALEVNYLYIFAIRAFISSTLIYYTIGLTKSYSSIILVGNIKIGLKDFEVFLLGAAKGFPLGLLKSLRI